MRDGEQEELQRLILSYLSGHPRAADSFRGICDWWIPMQRLCESEARVSAALDALVKAGLLVSQTHNGGAILYRAAAAAVDSPLSLGRPNPRKSEQSDKSPDIETKA
jgi:hypothetical protein